MKHTHYLINIVFPILLLSLHFLTSTSRVAQVNFVSKKWCLLSIALFYVGLRRPSPPVGYQSNYTKRNKYVRSQLALARKKKRASTTDRGYSHHQIVCLFYFLFTTDFQSVLIAGFPFSL